MKKTKFKVWQKLFGGWLHLNKMVFSGGVVIGIEDADGELYGINEVELMQFTGEIDKTDKEIYEGDIVEIETTGMNHRSDKIMGVVEYIDGCFDVVFNEPILDKSIDFWRKRLYVKCFVVNHAIKIIGNIYENPELLPKDAQGRVSK